MLICEWSYEVCYSDLGMAHQMRRGRGRLDEGAVGREVALEDRDAGMRLERRVEAVDHIPVPARGSAIVLPDRPAVRGESVLVEEAPFAEFTQHGRQAARLEEVLHPVAAGRQERKRLLEGKREAERLDLGGCRIIKKKNKQ